MYVEEVYDVRYKLEEYQYNSKRVIQYSLSSPKTLYRDSCYNDDVGTRGFKMLRPFGFNEFDGAGAGYAVKFASLVLIISSMHHHPFIS